MAIRASWKGWLKLIEVTAPVALYTAAPDSRGIALHTLNRETGNRVRREFVDEQTEELVERDQQVKGYETDKGSYVVLEQDELDEAIPESTKILEIDAFVPSREVDEVYLDSPYYLALADSPGAEGFSLIHRAMQDAGVAGIARTVLFRRERILLLCPRTVGFMAYTLHFGYEVRSDAEAFGGIDDVAVSDEMLDLGEHIIRKKMGKFDPDTFEDRYESALAELIRAKQAGKPLPKRPATPKGNVVDLMDALRRSAGEDEGAGRSRTASKTAGKSTAKKTATKNTAAKNTAAKKATAGKPAARRPAASRRKAG